jgi:protein involved in polysaccharide export with SLBB domain
MYQHLAFLTVFLAILSNSQASAGQTNSKSQAVQTDPIIAANGSGASNGSSNKTEGQNNSQQASEEAKRFYKMGVKYGRAGLFRQAAELFQKAIQLRPNYADAYYGLGHAHLDLGRWQEAIRSFERALKINPKDKGARAKLDEAYLMLGRETNRQSQSENQTAAAVPVSLTVPSESVSNNPAGASPAQASELTRVYRVGVGDVLDVRLNDAPAARSTLFTVVPPGLLEHPILAEPLPVSGLTVEEIKAKLEADLKRRAVNENPKVLVGIREYLSHAIIVSGLVKDPGTKILRREAIPLYVIIADAQPTAEAGRVTVVRHDTGEALIIDLSNPTELNLLVRPGDVITVHANPKLYFYVGGQVKAPGEKPFRAGITLTQAILAAGGLSRESKEAHLARDGGNGFLSLRRYKLKDINSGKLADPSVQPGDRIIIEN